MEVLESLIGAVRRCCAGFPDQRTGTNVRYSMADIGMGAFSLFFVQSPSFLDFQRRLEAGHGRSNCQTRLEHPFSESYSGSAAYAGARGC